VSFVLNSFQSDCTIPVVYTAPASAGSTPALLVNANGLPQTGYADAEGQATFFQASAAPANAAGYNVNVVSVNAAASTFVGTINSASAPTPGGTYTFNYGPSGSGFFYSDGTPLTAAQFGSYLSGSNAGQVQPNTATVVPVAGDQIRIFGYAPGVATAYQFDTTVLPANIGLGEPAALGSGDVPNAPTNVAASYNGAAYTTGGVSYPGVVATWTPPVNPDVSGSQAFTAPVANYKVYRSTVTNGTPGASTLVGTVAVVPGGTTPNNGTALPGTTSVSSPEFIDTSGIAGQSYVYYVTATSSGTGVPTPQTPETSPFSSGSTAVTAGTGASTPVIQAVDIVPSTGNVSVLSTFTFPAGTGLAYVTYNEPVSCLPNAGSDFSYSNSGGTPAGARPIQGNNCSVAPPGDYNGSTTNNAAKTLVVNFEPVTATTVGGVTTYAANNVSAPTTGDTFTYTAPATATPSNAVYVTGTVVNPVFAATQTVTDNGQTNTAGQTPVNPLSSGATGFTPLPYISSSTGSTTVTETFTYTNGPVTCDNTALAAGQFVDTSTGTAGTAIVCTGGAGATTVAVTFGAVVVGLGDTITYTQSTATHRIIAAAAAPAPGSNAVSPQTVAAGWFTNSL
jgi:hypothetical protein